MQDYYKYKSAILVANEEKDKEALRAIQKQLIVRYGLENEDVIALLKLLKAEILYITVKEIVSSNGKARS